MALVALVSAAFVAMVSAAFVAMVSATFVTLVSVAFVKLVQKDAHDHAIWTVAVVSNPVVTDHHPRHSLIGIGGRDRSRDTFSALALHFPSAGGGDGGNPGGSPGGSGVPGDSRGAGGVSGGSRGTSSKNVNLGGGG